MEQLQENQVQTPEQKVPLRVSLPTKTINEILGMLSQMPYNQSAAMIQKIQAEVVGIPDEPADISLPVDVPEQPPTQ